MSITSYRKLSQIAEAQVSGEIDLKAEVRAGVGDVSGIHVAPYKVLVAVVARPAKQGSIWLPDKAQSEDRFQGKTGLVLKLGPGCFEDTASHKFHGFKVDVNDWVGFRPSDGWEHFRTDPDNPSDGYPMRLFSDFDIQQRLDHPFLIY